MCFCFCSLRFTASPPPPPELPEALGSSCLPPVLPPLGCWSPPVGNAPPRALPGPFLPYLCFPDHPSRRSSQVSDLHRRPTGEGARGIPLPVPWRGWRPHPGAPVLSSQLLALQASELTPFSPPVLGRAHGLPSVLPASGTALCRPSCVANLFLLVPAAFKHVYVF